MIGLQITAQHNDALIRALALRKQQFDSSDRSTKLTTSKFSGAAGKRPCACLRTEGLRRGQSPSPLSRTVIR
jgi:hypothetical protein